MSITIDENTLKEINKIVFDFLWNGQPDKVNRKEICRTYKMGGLKMVSIFA